MRPRTLMSYCRGLSLLALATLATTGPAEPQPRPGDARQADVVLRLDKGEEVQRLCLSPDNASVVAAIWQNDDKMSDLYKWDLRTKRRQKLTWLGKHRRIRGVRWSGDGKTIVAYNEWWAGWFDAATGAMRAELTVRDARHGGLRYEEWDGDDLTKCRYFKGRYEGPLTLVGGQALLPDLQPAGLRLFDFKKAGEQRALELPAAARSHFKNAEFPLAAVSADGSTVALAECAQDVGDKVRVWVWDVAKGKSAREIVYAPRQTVAGTHHFVALDRTGSRLVAAIYGFAPARVFDVRKGEKVRECQTRGGILLLACSPAADLFACRNEDHVEVWGTADGKRRATFADVKNNCLYGDAEGGLRFSPDGTRLAWGGSEAICVAAIPPAP